MNRAHSDWCEGVPTHWPKELIVSVGKSLAWSRFRKDISSARLSLDCVLDIVSGVLLVKAAQARTSQRPDWDELGNAVLAVDCWATFQCETWQWRNLLAKAKWSLCQNLEIHLCILTFLISNSEGCFISVEKRALLFVGPVLYPCVNSASHYWHYLSQIFNCETVKHICSMCEGKGFGGF